MPRPVESPALGARWGGDLLRRPLLRREHEDAGRGRLPGRAALDVERAVVGPQAQARDAGAARDRRHAGRAPSRSDGGSPDDLLDDGRLGVAAASTPTVTSSIQVTPIRVTPTTAPPTTASCGTGVPSRTGTPSSLRTTPATHSAVRPPALTTAAMRVPSRESAMPAIAVAPAPGVGDRRRRRRRAGRRAAPPGRRAGRSTPSRTGRSSGRPGPPRVSRHLGRPFRRAEPHDRAGLQRAAARSRSAPTWTLTGARALDRGRSPGIVSSSSPVRKPKPASVSTSGGAGHPRRAHRDRLGVERRRRRRHHDLVTPAVAEARLQLREHAVERVADSRRAAPSVSVDLGHAVVVDGHRRDRRATRLGEGGGRRTPRATRSQSCSRGRPRCCWPRSSRGTSGRPGTRYCHVGSKYISGVAMEDGGERVASSRSRRAPR